MCKLILVYMCAFVGAIRLMHESWVIYVNSDSGVNRRN
jgi:hypothetical protein